MNKKDVEGIGRINFDVQFQNLLERSDGNHEIMSHNCHSWAEIQTFNLRNKKQECQSP
jgi:hypothetical protein